MQSINRITGFFIERRRLVQVIIGLSVFIAVSYLGISLWWLLAAGAASGIIFGKVFCRWMCPMGFLLELLTGIGGENSKFQQTYQYHKIGCPIAWISGLLNRISIFKIHFDKDSCKNCGLCDKACYISSLEKEQFSLFKKDKKSPGEAYACSKCLSCVKACPSGSLSYKAGFKTIIL